ncbi:MAG: class I SAM-dependent methyltransferase [Xenococcaceae cyanobacterium]
MKQIIKKVLNYFPINVTFYQKGYGYELDRYYSYQKQYVNFDIREKDKVLDIGSGGYPFPLATHLADFYEGMTTHRTEELKRDSRPFTVCSVDKTPFADKEFDFVYCSHVLEHVENPAKACEELMRIGKRGYIETPSKISDVMFNFTKIPNHHKWHIQVLDNTMIFMEWKDSERRDLGTDDFFYRFHSNWKNPFQDLIHNNRDLFVNMMLWKDRFNYIVIDQYGEILNTTKFINKE